MFRGMGMWIITVGVLAGLCGSVKADEISELRKQLEDQYNAIQQVRIQLIELEKKQAEMPPPRDTDFRAFWNEGLRFETRDKTFKLQIGGRIHYDWTFMSGDRDIQNAFDTGDGAQFRRARLYFQGDIYDNTGFKLQLDFAGGDVAFKDAYLSFNDFPLGTLKVGQFKEPFSLDQLTSSNNITFMERSLADVFAPGRNIGAMLSDSVFDQRMTWAAGVFRETADDTVRVKSNDGYNVTGRITYNPIYEDNGAQVLHLGAAVTHKTTQNDQLRYRQRPEAHLTDRFVDTADIAADSTDILGLEAAWVAGPFSLQGEYMKAMVEGTGGQPDVDFDGWYVQGSYWLTGEHRRYKRSSGAFDFVRPNRNYSKDGGWGAWELAARYSELDLNDRTIEGGKLNTITTGLNWHLNPNTRLMWNYVYADRDKIGKADIYQMRFQVHF